MSPAFERSELCSAATTRRGNRLRQDGGADLATDVLINHEAHEEREGLSTLGGLVFQQIIRIQLLIIPKGENEASEARTRND